MAEPYQPINVSTGSAQQAIQSTPNVVPSLDGLMESVRSGFISADDIRKRVQSGPLEAATRAQDTADVQEVRPLQRQAAVAELGNVQAKQAFEAASLPILNETKRANLEQAHQNALQFGLPEEILKVFYASVPGFIQFDPDKLHDKKTGQVNIPYANEMIVKAKQEAAKMSMNKGTIVKSETTDAAGAKQAYDQLINMNTGAEMGPKVPTGSVEPDAAKAAAAKNQVSEGLRKEFYGADPIQAFNKVDAAVNKIRLSATPESTPFQDMSAIFGFMKVLDPGSTVREGEYATVEKSRGWPEAFRGAYNKAISGQKLTPEQKSQLLSSAEENYQGQLKNALPAIRQFAELETKNGFSPGTIVPVEFSERLKSSGGSLADMSIEELKNVSIEGRGAGAIPTVTSVSEANALPANIEFFKTPTGQNKRNKNFRASGTTAAPASGNLADMTIEQLKEIPIEGLGGRSLADLSIEELKNITIAP